MELYLLRHGASTANERRLVCGAEDFPLSATGHEQAQRVCENLARIPFTRVYSSPLSRARDTVAALDCIDRPVRIVPEIAELNTGAHSHRTLDELWAMDARFRQPWLSPDMRYPEGECFREMVARMTGWYDRESKQWNSDDVVLVVGHEGTLRSILLRLLGLDISAYPAFPIGNCDLLRATVDAGQPVTYTHIPLTAPVDQS
ncbi:MAG TPA: histidine phosphatase family protein [Paraburkholderia sp.]|uniref:histidine phosphatase family protein n=1 Tax=Paraburkholderia sp. TaxID=1926495 RepID=UPI002ED54A9B